LKKETAETEDYLLLSSSTMRSSRPSVSTGTSLPPIREEVDGRAARHSSDLPQRSDVQPLWGHIPIRVSEVPASGSESPPPAYSEAHTVIINEKPVRRHVFRFLAGRGGWKKLGLIAVILAFGIVGLVAGLAAGLSGRNDRQDYILPYTAL
jgi:hypothetical protein